MCLQAMKHLSRARRAIGEPLPPRLTVRIGWLDMEHGPPVETQSTEVLQNDAIGQSPKQRS